MLCHEDMFTDPDERSLGYRDLLSLFLPFVLPINTELNRKPVGD